MLIKFKTYLLILCIFYVKKVLIDLKNTKSFLVRFDVELPIYVCFPLVMTHVIMRTFESHYRILRKLRFQYSCISARGGRYFRRSLSFTRAFIRVAQIRAPENCAGE